MSGTVGLVGSGEYLPSMLKVEGRLIAGRSPVYVQVPTAASLEGQKRVQYWIGLGLAQAERLGVKAVPLMILDRDSANDKKVLEPINEAGLIYFSGGSPSHLISTIEGTLLQDLVFKAFDRGAAVAGCSAGAMALGTYSLGFHGMVPKIQNGLGLAPNVAILPHFDRFRNRVTDTILKRSTQSLGGVWLIGVDEETALIGSDATYEVMGKGSAWVISRDGFKRYASGETIEVKVVEN